MKDVFEVRNLKNKDASNAILQLRREKNLSQDELAKALGISISAVCLYEQGKRFPNARISKKICDYFGVDMNYLYGISENKNTLRSDNMNNKVVTVYNRKKLLNGGAALSDTNKMIFSPDFVLFDISLPKSRFIKNKFYFGIIATESKLQPYGVNPDDICIFQECNASDVASNKIVCVLIDEKVPIRKLVRDNEAVYLYSGIEDTKPVKVSDDKEVVIGQLAKVISDK